MEALNAVESPLQSESSLSLESEVSLTSPLKERPNFNPSAEKHIRMLATLVPDELIYLYQGKTTTAKQSTHTGVLFFADVSGFTDLCERFTKQDKGGASRITKVLNEYISVMVQEIMSHNGDILKFSGDAFLALWKLQDYTSSMSDVVHAAIDCALGIQKSHGQYKTDVGIILRVKIAIAAGQIIITVVGDSNFMVLGNAMFDVKDVGNICNPGDIILSPTVKMFLSANQYILENISGIPFIKVLGLGSEWSPSQLSSPYELFDNLQDKVVQNEEYDSDMSLVTETEDVFTYVLRPSIDYAVHENLKDYLRKFIISPVVRAVDLGEALENLTEMRQVVIVFINVLTRVFNLKQLDELLESTYSKVCEITSNTGGCVNKVSMFDKDLMFLVIFGLRGFKHKLQAQQALYCAKSIRDKLIHTNQVVSASIGVTTGATYCGVVGHPMRKEYTVIGRTVNKAARLMIAYPDMVTCDRQTFLESQLQSRFFTLQPVRYLKGFTNVGPIYKFNDDYSEENIIEKEMLKTNTYPILDRPNELALFFGLLHLKTPDHSAISLLNRQMTTTNLFKEFKLDEKVDYNMMIIQGAPRRGKSRILNEIAFYVKNEIPHYKCTLNKNSRLYKIFRCIFCEGCKITNVKDLNTRTKYVWRTIAPFKVPQFLCALNDMLYVSFEVTPPYLKLNYKQLLYVKQKMVKYLGRKIFKTVSLVTIDNLEYLDTESWILYNEIINNETIFTCATVSTNANLCEESKYLIEAKSTVSIKLEPIHEWYHGALICQFLNVRGVALELERYVQVNSYGNPGWIESFLTTLRHSTILKKVDMERSHAYKQGYVLPDQMYLRRKNTRYRHGSKSYYQFDENPFRSLTEGFNTSIEGWDIYMQTIPEVTDETVNAELISICTLSNDVSLEEIDTEEQVDILMLRTYDSLNVEEQHVLKCSSIIGDEFTRNQLEYVMQSNNDIKTAVAIQILFEIQVFGCLRATYNDGDITIRHCLTDPQLDKTVKCECEGFPDELFHRNLPKYANCNYICFREPAFRKMCMNLLTESQANLYHIRAVWYLENQTKRCNSCHLEYFTQINGQINDDGMQKYSIKAFRDDKQSNIDLTTIHEKHAFDLEDWPSLRKEPIWSQLSKSVKARTFLDTNLVDCRCVDILITMYSEIIEHNQELGRYDALMNSILEYAVLCIRNNNTTVAITLIGKATVLLDETLKYSYPEPAWQVPLLKGRILTLRGQLQIKKLALPYAERSLLAALRMYNLEFPTSKLAIKAAIKYHKFKQKLLLIYYPEKYIGSNDNDVRVLAEQTSETLANLYVLYCKQFKFEKAYLASLWGLTQALRSNANFYLNCVAFRNASSMDCSYHRPGIIERIEEMAIEMCYSKHTRLETFEFEAVIKMYVAIYRRKALCVNIYNSLWLGTVIVHINSPQFGGLYSTAAPFIFIRSACYTYQMKEAIMFIRDMLDSQDIPSIKGNLQNCKYMVRPRYISDDSRHQPAKNLLN